MSAPAAYKDSRKDNRGNFSHGPKESPAYQEYVPPVFALMDLYFDTVPGSPDALRLVRLLREKMWRPSD